MSESKSLLSHIEPFNGTNFQLGKYNCWLILEQNDLLDIVEGRLILEQNDLLDIVEGKSKEPEPHVVSGSITNSKQNTDARVILMTTISSKEQQAFVKCKTAKSIWVKLAAQYLIQNVSASTHVLQARFFHYQFLKGHSTMSHVTAIEGLAQQLEDLGSPMFQSQIMTKIVSTLPTAFRNSITVWDNLPETEKTLIQLIMKLMNEQHRNVCTSPSSSMITPVNTDIEALAATSESNRSINSWERRALESGRPSQSIEKQAVIPDIDLAVGQAARFCQNLGKAHLSAVKRILSYLADSDYAGDKDPRRSTSFFSSFFTSTVPYRGEVPDNHAPLVLPQRRNTLQLLTPPKKLYGFNASSYKLVTFSLAPFVFCATFRARSV